MSWVYYNPNPMLNRSNDCVVRAICRVTGWDWDTAYLRVAMKGYELKDMPSVNSVWSALLYDLGYRRHSLPDTCPDCYTVRRFCLDFPEGVYILATGSHVVAVENGDYYDGWDSGEEVPIYCWRKEIR